MRSSLPRTARLLLGAGLLSLLAACNAGKSVPTANASLEGYTPDPALKTAPKSNLVARVQNACTIVQGRQQKVEPAALAAPCGCYAKQTVRAMTPAEIAAYRSTGYFNDTATAKAYEALDACKLPRPV
ncbi:hypothetical protein [Methylobacterium organophilum]|uniref:Lipoprotein n=1 Tax=Methylobacterium organophilum TaxID=410 RepID=A0ABQ4T5E6_METOR|nr:hypothetical protein [Methylobacterium organophilum]UMY17095.1 hypothetical protein MMB17_20985 [Methylobacterium organophilum]GJE26880.1 hypothetical protein LKMONMHP_1734 [Methylobacterium organophilum]